MKYSSDVSNTSKRRRAAAWDLAALLSQFYEISIQGERVFANPLICLVISTDPPKLESASYDYMISVIKFMEPTSKRERALQMLAEAIKVN